MTDVTGTTGVTAMTDVTVSDRSGVRILAISRPHRANALRRETIGQLLDAVDQIQDSPSAGRSLRGVVITGDGVRFSAGADLQELTGTSADGRFDRALDSLTGAIAACPLPVVAAIEGPCFGAAVDLAWSCDVVVVSAAARICIPAVRLGILYNPVALARLHSRMGSSLLSRLMVLGEELSGAEVLGLGAVPADEGRAVAVAEALVTAVPDGRHALPARAVTKELLAALDVGAFDPEVWEERRRALLDLPDRSQVLRVHRDSLGGGGGG